MALVQIGNNTSRLVSISIKGATEKLVTRIRLVPGTNLVDGDQWAEARKLGFTKNHMDAGYLVELDSAPRGRGRGRGQVAEEAAPSE